MRAKYLRLTDQDVAAFDFHVAVHVSLAELYEVIDESSGKTLILIALTSSNGLNVDEEALVQRDRKESSGKDDFKLADDLVDRPQFLETLGGIAEHIVSLVELPK